MGKLNQNKESYCLCERCYYFYVPAFFAALEKYAKVSFMSFLISLLCHFRPLRPLSFWSFQNHSIRHIVAHF